MSDVKKDLSVLKESANYASRSSRSRRIEVSTLWPAHHCELKATHIQTKVSVDPSDK